jgi:histone demethylase JARID1
MPVSVYFQGAEEQEMIAMRNLRLENLKKRVNDTGEAKYCVCHRGVSGFMLQCELCKDWFHGTYIIVPFNLNYFRIVCL